MGFFASLSHAERSLYFFLVLAADRNGVSFHAHDRICAELELSLDEYLAVRNRLIDMDLIAFDGSRFQVLSLPPAPVPLAKPVQIMGVLGVRAAANTNRTGGSHGARTVA